MAKRLSAFLMPTELRERLVELVGDSHPEVIAESWRQPERAVFAIDDPAAYRADRFLLPETCLEEGIPSDPELCDLVSIDLPRLTDGRLTLCVIACQGTGAAAQTLTRLKRAMTRRLTSGVKIWNVNTVSTDGSAVCRNIWTSPGAAEFYQQGGELMQRGVKNTRFAPLR